MPLPVLTPGQSASWDAAAVAAGISLETLMESAGRAVAFTVAQRYADRLRDGVVIATGPGNNGGDGWVLARAFHQAGISTWVIPAGEGASSLAQHMATLATAAGVRTLQPDGPWPRAGLAVDALLGTGAKGPPRPAITGLVERLADLRTPLVAIDGPTGLDLTSGVSYIPTRADLTVTFGGLRRGHLLARDDVGTVLVVEIGHPPPDSSWPTLFTDSSAAELMPRFTAASHKGDRGRVVIVGGNVGMSGAIRMAGRAAFAAGAGLVHAVAPEKTVAALMVAEPDLQTLSHEVMLPLSPDFESLLHRADAVVIGPGLGRGDGTADFVLAVIKKLKTALIDADALTVLQGRVPELADLARSRCVVITPHHGEFRSLFPDHSPSQESDPWLAAEGAAEASQATVLLKGVPTVIARAGAADITVAAGNPGLATGGSGDLLSGLIGAFLALGSEPDVAAALGAQCLGRAADMAARRTGARSLRPMDVVAAVPDLWRSWDMDRKSPSRSRFPILLELELPQLY